MFKHWKEAETRANELKTEIDTLTASITEAETEARKEDTTIERRGELIADLQAKTGKRDGLQADYNNAIKARDDMKRAEETQFGLLSSISTPRVEERLKDMEKPDVYETRAYELAWAKYIRDKEDSAVRDILNTQNKESAGILVPTVLVNEIEDKIRDGGCIVSLCSIDQIKGLTTYPIVNSKSNPKWHKEVDSQGKPVKKERKTVKLGSVSMEPEFVAEILETTKKFEALTIDAFWSWLRAELPDAVLRVLDAAVLTAPADGEYGIRGITTNTESRFVATLGNHTLNFNTANMAVGRLQKPHRQNITAVMHQETFFDNYMALKDTAGRPIFKLFEDNKGRPSYYFGSYPIVFSEEIRPYDTAAAGEPYIVMGDFKAMRLNFPMGMHVQITRDDVTRKDENIIEYLSEILVGGNITRLGSFVKVTK